jgi:hypothetical protein
MGIGRSVDGNENWDVSLGSSFRVCNEHRSCAYAVSVDSPEIPEPPVRINTDLCDTAALGWSEAKAWDELFE